MPLILADAGPLYGIIDVDDQYHARARNEFRQLTAQGLQTTVVVTTVFESHFLLQRKLGIQVARTWLTDLTRGGTFVYLETSDYELAFTTIARFPDQDLTLFDTVLYVVSERLQIPIWTYDHHFDILRAQRWYPA